MSSFWQFFDIQMAIFGGSGHQLVPSQIKLIKKMIIVQKTYQYEKQSTGNSECGEMFINLNIKLQF